MLRRSMLKWMAWAALALSANAFLPAHPAAATEKTFTFRLSGEPETLDWNRAHTPIETYVLMNLMEGLLALDSGLKVVPSLAESWTISKDGKTYTFKIKPGVKWSNGVPLRAEDFVYSWKRLLSPLTAASYAYLLFDIEGAEDFNRGKIKDFSQVAIKAVDPRTFQVKLNRPVAHWIYIPTFWVTFPLREDVVSKYGNTWAAPGKMVNLGPYSLSSYELNTKITLKANPNYHGKRGNIETVTGLIVQDDSTAMNLYEAGKLDFLTDISTLELKRLEKNPELKTFPYLKTGYIGFVATKFPFTHAKVRRAFSMAIDKAKLGDILHGGQVPAQSFIPPKMMGYSPKVGLPFDPAKAKAELRASGVSLGPDQKIDIVVPNSDKALTIAQFVQAELKRNLGVNVVLQPYDNKTFRTQLDMHTYPLFVLSWSADYPDPDNFMSIFLGSVGNNRTTWKNSKYDELVLKARGLMNVKEREKLYSEAGKILVEDEAAILPLYYEPNMALVRSGVSGLVLNPLNYLYLKDVGIR